MKGTLLTLSGLVLLLAGILRLAATGSAGSGSSAAAAGPVGALPGNGPAQVVVLGAVMLLVAAATSMVES